MTVLSGIWMLFIITDLDTHLMENSAILASSWQSPVLISDPNNQGDRLVEDISNGIIQQQISAVEDNM